MYVYYVNKKNLICLVSVYNIGRYKKSIII